MTNETKKLIAALRKSVQEMIVIPNSWLPEEFHDNVRGGRTLARLNKLCDIRDGVDSVHAKTKAIKARNIEILRAQVEANSQFNERGDFVDIAGPLDYSDCEIDENQLYKNQCALVGGMVNGGLIEADDLMED